MSTVAVGDVHGESAALDDLLAKVLPTLDAADTLVFLGDYVDRGPDSRGVLERIARLRQGDAPCRVECLLGNHEEWLLRTFEDPRRHSWFVGMSGASTVRSYAPEVADELLALMQDLGVRLLTEKLALPYERFFDLVPAAHLELLRGLSSFVRTPDVVCVHGGVDPGQGPVEEQPAKVLCWGTNDFPEAYAGADTIVYGHKNNAVLDEEGWPRPRVLSNGTWGIDTIAHGVLTALRFPEGEVIQSARFACEA